MTTAEHIAKIRAKCVELLEIAEKRTTGKWEMNFQLLSDGSPFVNIRDQAGELITDVCYPPKTVLGNSHFIASCAGPAEAGWRATIAAIDYCKSTMHIGVPEELVDSIIAAWPEDLL